MKKNQKPLKTKHALSSQNPFCLAGVERVVCFTARRRQNRHKTYFMEHHFDIRSCWIWTENIISQHRVYSIGTGPEIYFKQK